MTDRFYNDLCKFGKARAMTRMVHRDRWRDFRRRQIQLAAVGFWFIALFLLLPHAWFLGPFAALVFQTATDEARRMHACGRYWQCKRSIEVIGI